MRTTPGDGDKRGFRMIADLVDGVAEEPGAIVMAAAGLILGLVDEASGLSDLKLDVGS